MTAVAYFDCFSGASGDMILGALVDAGLPPDDLRAALASLPLSGYAIDAERVTRAGIAATRVRVRRDDTPQPRRTLSDILDILDGSALPADDRATAGRIFRALAEAEAKVHGATAEDVHFHEVGAVDAIVDVTGAVAGLRLLGVRQVYVAGLAAGRHGARRARPAAGSSAGDARFAGGRRGSSARRRRRAADGAGYPHRGGDLTTLGGSRRPAMALHAARAASRRRNCRAAKHPPRLAGRDGRAPGMRAMTLVDNVDDAFR
ncbi:MAG: nickel insertion protein [Dehalococcoidia bacterium]